MGDEVVVAVLATLNPKPVEPARPVPVPVGNRVVEFAPPKPGVPAEGVKNGRARRAMMAKSGVANALLKQKKARREQAKVVLIGAIAPDLNLLVKLRQMDFLVYQVQRTM